MPTNPRFGGFFRSKRKSLSPSLREFCRRNGFDAGNISRVERGLVPPPQSRQILENYAKALKLDEGTADWDRFFEMAAAETGRIPADVLGDQQRVQRLPSLFRQMRSDAQGQGGWVKARHLESWADTLDARAALPELLRRLIRATGKEIRQIEFPAEEQTQRPGWDGIVEAAVGDVYVPRGTSVWEMGVGKIPQKKAAGDFRKRDKSPLGLDRKKTTFVFVTPRAWLEKTEWAKDTTASGQWKEVRAYDSATLEEWLEQAPAVDAWLARRLGLRPPGVVTFDQYWENLQGLTEPSLKPEVFLASREAQVKELASWLDGPAGALAIQTRSPTEAIDFVAAYSRDPKHAELFATRALIVEDRNAWRSLAMSSDTGLLLVGHPSLCVEPELIAEAVRRGNRVLLPSSQEQREHVSTLRLARIYRFDLEKALESSGMERYAAQKRAREAGGSLTVLKRLLGRYPDTMLPEWSKPQETPSFTAMLLAGSWNESFEGDRDAVARLANRPYDEVAGIAGKWAKAPDPPISRIEARWSLVSRDDSWFLLASTIQPDDLRRYEAVALDVLGEDDPAFELPSDKRWEASFRKNEQKYSQALRNGLAETLALLGSRPEKLPQIGGIPHRVVQTLLQGREWQRWASLSYQLPLLAEAGPQAFLSAVEKDLARTEPVLARLFGEAGDFLFSAIPHTGLLWALEVLSWDRTLLPQVSLILASLDEKMPKGKSGNTAFRSLSEIFMPWFPQTTAPVEERVRILRMLLQRHPDAGWRLLVAQLPNQFSNATDLYRPSWRDWALSWSQGVTNADYWRQIGDCAELLVEAMGGDVGRWKTLIKLWENLPAPSAKHVLDRLSALAETVDEDVRRDVSDTIREKVAKHRRHAKAFWALHEGRLEELETLQGCFQPQDTIRKNAWLFGLRWTLMESFANDEKLLDESRLTALRQILDESGIEGILRLAAAVATAEEVGASFAAVASSEHEAKILPAFLGAADERSARFAHGYLRERFAKDGWAWVEGLDFTGWSVEQIARLLIILPSGIKTWEFAERQRSGVEAWYWRHVPPYMRGEDLEEARHAIDRFLEHKRASGAFHVIRMALHDKLALQPGLLIEVLESWLEHEMPSWTAADIHSVKYELDLLFEELQKVAEQEPPIIEISRLAKLEWACLALLDGYPTSPLILQRLLRDEPAFFVDVLGLCFRPMDESPKAESEFSEKEKLAAQNAYRLLMSWRDVPGSDEGIVDEDRLYAWIKKARTLATERRLVNICDSKIGEVLAHAPKEIDGSWPCIPVRDALEEIGTDEVFSGFGVGMFNKRGLVSRSLREGGAQERTLAESYRGFAEACKIEWPKTAAALRNMAATYDEHARREDIRADLESG